MNRTVESETTAASDADRSGTDRSDRDTSDTSRSRRRGGLNRSRRRRAPIPKLERTRLPYLLIAPVVVFMALVHLVPMVAGGILSFKIGRAHV